MIGVHSNREGSSGLFGDLTTNIQFSWETDDWNPHLRDEQGSIDITININTGGETLAFLAFSMVSKMSPGSQVEMELYTMRSSRWPYAGTWINDDNANKIVFCNEAKPVILSTFRSFWMWLEGFPSQTILIYVHQYFIIWYLKDPWVAPLADF